MSREGTCPDCGDICLCGAGRDPRDRLAAFVKRYGAVGVRVRYEPTARDPWALDWCRTYAGCTSDERSMRAKSFDAVVSEAERWESENDRRDPDHAAAAGVLVARG